MILSAVQENYLKTVWYLSQKEDHIRPIVLAEYFSVKAPTVLTMVNNLKRMNMLEYDRANGISLTPAGTEKALFVLRKHRLIETFLEKTLALEPDLVHREAEELEHVISEELLMHIDRYLDYPQFDPHGSFIPLSGKARKTYPLNEVGRGFSVLIITVADSKELKHYKEQGLIPGSHWFIEDVSPDGEAILLKQDSNFLAISGSLASEFKVTLDNGQEHNERN